MKFFITAVFFSMFSSFFTQGMVQGCGKEQIVKIMETDVQSLIQEESAKRKKIEVKAAVFFSMFSSFFTQRMVQGFGKEQKVKTIKTDVQSLIQEESSERKKIEFKEIAYFYYLCLEARKLEFLINKDDQDVVANLMREEQEKRAEIAAVFFYMLSSFFTQSMCQVCGSESKMNTLRKIKIAKKMNITKKKDKNVQSLFQEEIHAREKINRDANEFVPLFRLNMYLASLKDKKKDHDKDLVAILMEEEQNKREEIIFEEYRFLVGSEKGEAWVSNLWTAALDLNIFYIYRRPNLSFSEDSCGCTSKEERFDLIFGSFVHGYI